MLRLRSYLIALVLVAVMPLAAFSVGVSWWAANLQTESDLTDLRRAAFNTAATVAIDLARTNVLIEAMARSPVLAEGDISSFDRHMRAVTAATGVVLLLGTKEGVQVINTSVPEGQPIPAIPRPDIVELTLKQGKPLLTDGILAPLLKRPMAGLLTSVPNGRPSAIVVAARIDPIEMARLLPPTLRWPGAFTVVYDGKGVPFTARNQPNGFLPNLGAESTDLASAIETIAGTGWKVAAFAPRSAIAGSWSFATKTMIIVGAIASLGAALLAVLLGRFLVREASSLMATARLLEGNSSSLGRGSLVHEVGVLRQALASAAASGRDRLLEQTRLSGLKTIAEELKHKVAERTKELEETAGRLLNAQDDERRRIARDLHDSTVQELVAASLHLQAAYTAANGAGSTDLREAMMALGRAKDELRTVSFAMQPPLLDECGLSTAIHSFGEGFGRRAGLEVTFEGPSHDPELPRAIETALFRIVQEALTNIHRHAHSPSAHICLEIASGIASIEIVDRGIGLAAAGVIDSAAGSGIPGMRARIRQLGGELIIQTSAKGTTVRASVAVESEGKLVTAA